MITMETLITSVEPSTEEQRKQCVRVLTDATEKAVNATLDNLHQSGILTKINLEQVLAAGGRIGTVVAETARAKILEIASGRVGCLKRVFPEKKFIIGSTTGTETLASARDIFGSNIDANFANWECNEEERPTSQMEAVPFEMFENGNYSRIFGSFGLNPVELCFTTPQIKCFVAEHAKSLLRENGWRVFLFLFKRKAKNKDEKDEFFVARVRWYSDGDRSVRVDRFSYGRVWYAEYRALVFLPQQVLVK